MWWPVVFWLLLIPLIIVETIIFVKTKKLFWLLYAVSIFVYVVAVSYTLDVFDAGRNAVILTLLASAVLMALIGRHFRKNVKKRKAVSRGTLNGVLAIGAVILIVFVVSVIFGRAHETLTPAQSILEEEIVHEWKRDDPRAIERYGDVVLATRTLTNEFFLPVPVPRTSYRACLHSSSDAIELYVKETPGEEVAPFSSVTTELRVGAHRTEELFVPYEIRVYESEDRRSWEPCGEIPVAPLFRIPVE